MGKELTEAPFDYGIFGSLFRLFLCRNEIKWMSWGGQCLLWVGLVSFGLSWVQLVCCNTHEYAGAQA